ncbi:MAG: lipopolysaccharide assembly protein LapA domain-containing protein [Rickettsiales bacterium]
MRVLIGRILYISLFVALCGFSIVFALENAAEVNVRLPFLDIAISAPLFIIVIGFIILGVLLGILLLGIYAFPRIFSLKRKLKKQSTEANAHRQEATALRLESDLRSSYGNPS